MDRLQSMKVFTRVAQRAGFAAAARDLSMSVAAVSKHVSALETQIGVRLFDRTTRRVGLTEAAASISNVASSACRRSRTRTRP